MFIEYFNNLSRFDIFKYVVISIIIIWFFTTVVKIEIGHILALLIIAIILLYLTDIQNISVDDFNTQMEFKLNSLQDNPNLIPEYFYIDADIINLFYNIKQNFSTYNVDSYNDALDCANNLLKIRYDVELDLCESGNPPNVNQNFVAFNNSKDLPLVSLNKEVKEDTICKSKLNNILENYFVAEEQMKKCMNYLESLIISIPHTYTLEQQHTLVMKRAQIILKRNLDVIKGVLDKYDPVNAQFITDYDTPKPINKAIGINNINDNTFGNNQFNFY